MGNFENMLGSLGRWIDSVVEHVRERFSGVRVPSPRRSPGEWIGEQSTRAAESIGEIKHQWSNAPDDQRRRWTIALVVFASLFLGGGAGYTVYRLNGGPGTMTSSDAAALNAVEKKMKDAETTTTPSQLFPGAK